MTSRWPSLSGLTNCQVQLLPPPPLHKTLSVLELVYRCHCSMLTHTVLLRFCLHLLANRNIALDKIIKLTFLWHLNIKQCLSCCTYVPLKDAFSSAKFCQIVHIDLCVIFYIVFVFFFVFYFQTSTYAIADNSSYGLVGGFGHVVGAKVTQIQTKYTSFL